MWLLGASYYFYMSWQPAYALLIATSTLVDYAAAIRMGGAPEPRRRFWLLLSLATNLGLLFVFKYYEFFGKIVSLSSGFLGTQQNLPNLDVLLPVGISFYTFQTLSYSIDVYKGRVVPERNFTRFALYVSFFPQLVAGPIERATSLLPQLATHVPIRLQKATNGIKLILWGLFKKMVVADRLAMAVEVVYSQPETSTGPAIALATFLFAYQIYCDFSGYSDIAIGAAQVLGIRLMTNFDRPYASRSISEFWRRWHISLSTWFRDYVYIPLGGSRGTTISLRRNLLIVFVLSGVWHGANFTFVVWGLLHGLYMIVGNVTRVPRQLLASAVGADRFPRVMATLQTATVWLLVCFAWIFFRAEGIRDSIALVTALGSGWSELGKFKGWNQLWISIGFSIEELLLVAALITITEWISWREKEDACRSMFSDDPFLFRWSFYVLGILAVCNLSPVGSTPFIYFQF